MKSHYPTVASHSSQRRVYDTLLETIYCPHKAATVDYAVRKCRSCAWSSPKFSHSRNMLLIMERRPLKLIATSIDGPFPKIGRGNQRIYDIINCCAKLTQVVLTLKTAAALAASLSVEDWLIPYFLATYLLADDGAKLVNRFSTAECAILGVRHLTTTVYHLQTDDLA